jgi:hypothetical protein
MKFDWIQYEQAMKVLLLGSGRKYQGRVSKCHSCMTQEEYNYCISQSEVVRLDIDPEVEPDVVAAVHHAPWADKVLAAKGGEFDVIIDEISCQDGSASTTSTASPSVVAFYQDEAAKLLKSDGLFYGWFDHKKVVWINTDKGLVL